jgi:hypothetical protein
MQKFLATYKLLDVFASQSFVHNGKNAEALQLLIHIRFWW